MKWDKRIQFSGLDPPCFAVNGNSPSGLGFSTGKNYGEI
jgi:hypothetical protein